jgi:hypothetical protein
VPVESIHNSDQLIPIVVQIGDRHPELASQRRWNLAAVQHNRNQSYGFFNAENDGVIKFCSYPPSIDAVLGYNYNYGIRSAKPLVKNLSDKTVTRLDLPEINPRVNSRSAQLLSERDNKSIFVLTGVTDENSRRHDSVL